MGNNSLMKPIGIFICNYNGADFVVKCIESLERQTIQNFDIYVIDNASTDHTPEIIRKAFGDKVSLLCNSENLGGAGGFNCGLEYGIFKGYEYIGLLDNDIVLAEDTVEHLYDAISSDLDMGIVGAKIMIMDSPEFIQDFCNHISFKEYKEICGHFREHDTENLDKLEYCDYVPTCAVLIRTEALKIAGTMPVDNFIYYDDIEMSYRMGLFGYKVGAYGKAKVWHKGGFRKKAVNTFSKYYFLRNRLNFFMKYVPEEKIEEFAECVLNQLFPGIIGCYYKKLTNTLQTTIYALDDAIHFARGKAEYHKILPVDEVNLLGEVLKDKKKIIIKIKGFCQGIEEDETFITLFWALHGIRLSDNEIIIHIFLENCPYETDFIYQKLKETAKKFEEDENRIYRADFNVNFIKKYDPESYDLVFQLCSHVRNIKENILPVMYIDGWCNVIRNERDYNLYFNYESYREFFIMLYKPLLVTATKKLREKINRANS